MSRGKRTVGPAIHAVKNGARLSMGAPPKVGLIVYGFDADQKIGLIWKDHLKKLEGYIGSNLVRVIGKAKDVKL
jgi:hypothetical protein